ncbi:MAG: methionyl-tRNA formyltransferase [Planctomycetota bacterium]|nr:MAG: methionyl-tRNA formyltransferase [Planctomycetota bacterium]
MRVVFFGSGEFAVPTLWWLINSHHEIAAVVTQPDRPTGRGKKPQPTPVATKAEEHNLPIERCEDVNAKPFIEKVRSLQADIGVVIAFGQKMSAQLCSVFPSECINLHASLLPKYRGASPISAAILAGETETGITVFRLVDRLDAGPILVQRKTTIEPMETCGELHDRLAGICCDAVDAALKLHQTDTLPPGEQQDESKVVPAPKLKKSDGYLRFDEPANKIALRCRAMWPWPGARCRYLPPEGKPVEVIICSASAIPKNTNAPAGTITDMLSVSTSAGMLEIHSLKPAGKRLMSWQDFVNGRHVKPGHCFESLSD